MSQQQQPPPPQHQQPPPSQQQQPPPSQQQHQQQPLSETTHSNQIMDLFTAHLVRELTTAVTSSTTEDDNHPNHQQSSPARAFQGLRRLREHMDQIHRLSNNHHYQSIPIPINHPQSISSHQHQLTHSLTPSNFPHPLPSNQTQPGQERTDEFRQHSIQRRSNHRPLPNLSDIDNHSLFQALKRWGDNRKRNHQDSFDQPHSSHHSLQTTQTSDYSNDQPTTAELAEQAARDSNPRHNLPAYYTPDDQELRVGTVVIPIDTNPMERRFTILTFSRDGTIRWKDNEQKIIYERSKDGLVGEEIGEIEFEYLVLPREKRSTHARFTLTNTTSATSSNPITHQQLDRPSSSIETDTARTIREAIENIDEARNQEPPTLRAHYDLQRWHIDRPGYRSADSALGVLVSRRPRNSGPESATQTTPPHGNSSQELTTRPARASRSASSSVGRLTRRPIRWFERPTARDLLGAASRASNPDPSLAEPLHSSSLYNPNHPLDQFLFSSTIHRSRY